MITGILTVLFVFLLVISILIFIVTGKTQTNGFLEIRGFSKNNHNDDDSSQSDRSSYIDRRLGWVIGGLTVATGYVLYFQWFSG